MKLSALEHQSSFALLGPGFGDGQCRLLTDLYSTADSPTLVYAPFECPGNSPMTFASMKSEAVPIECDLSPSAVSIRLRDDGYKENIARIREAIAAGDVYQICYTVPAEISSVSSADLVSIFCHNGIPRFLAWVKLPTGEEFVSASPELFFETNGLLVHAEPMKGTARQDGALEFELSEKDRAELAMIADLLRNDLTPVCKPRSVKVLCERRSIVLPYAIQTVSDVTGELLDHATPLDVLAALHPGGSVTGAPKQAALEHIHKLEPTPRGAYCGTLGLWRGDRSIFSLLIRTAARTSDGWVYGVGSGVVYDSNAETERHELHIKLGALGGLIDIP
jgi:para-aminobenzoate synthetase/4-amino-4-deoxychorismate lyase